jgi:hypothetical protein
VEWLGWTWTDLPMRVAVVGVMAYRAVILAFLWWASHHYVRCVATSWRWTTWERAAVAERAAVEQKQSASSDQRLYGGSGWIRSHNNGRDTSSR